MDISNLLKALENESNESLLNLTTEKIKEVKLNILKELNLSKSDTLELLEKLNKYKYIDEMNELKYGSYIRWIPIEDLTKIYLTNYIDKDVKH